MITTITLGASILVTSMATLFVLTCLFMMLVILIQKPKGGGLSGAFGGAGGSAQAAFGAKTGDLLTTITIACFVLFLGLAIGLVYAIRDDVAPRVRSSAATPPINQTTPAGPTDQPADALDQEAPTDAATPAAETETTVETAVDTATDQAPAAPAETPTENATPGTQP